MRSRLHQVCSGRGKPRRMPMRTKTRRRLTALAASIVSSALSATAGLAQPATHPEAPATVETLVVTAEKREQTLEKAPASVTAFSAKMLAAQQINNISDLASEVPNLYFAQSNGVEEIAIRGVSINTTNPQIDPVISLNIDGVYQPRVTSMEVLLSDLESIEVLRGPQGTLYGRNATGGVINVTTAKPTDTFEAGASALLGNYDRYMLKGYLSGPINDVVEMRLSGIIDNREGYGENLVTHSHGDSHEWSAKLAVRIHPTNNVLVDIAAYHLDASAVGAETYPMTPLGGPIIMALPAAEQISTDLPWKSDDGINGYNATQQNGVTATVTWTPAANLQVKSISGYVQSHYIDHYDSDGTPADLVLITSNYPSTMYSQELDLNATLWGRVDAVAGLYYMHETVDNHSFDAFPKGEPGYGVPPFDVNIDMPQVATSTAGFLDLTYHVSDKFRLEGGVRQTYDSTSVEQTAELIDLGGYECDALPGRLDNPSTTGKVGAQYDVTPTTMTYAQWQSGFKAGGYNFSVCGNQYQPEEIEAWEGGLKGRYFDNRLSLRSSIFYYDYTNMQVQEVTSPSSSDISNAGRSTIYGLEFEGTARLADPLTVDWGLTLTHSRYDSFVSINTALPQPSPIENLAGNTLVMAPDFTLRAGVSYIVPLGEAGDLTLRGEVFHSDTVYFTPFDESIAKQPRYTLGSLFASYRPRGSKVEFTAFAKNIGNVAYRISGYTLGAFFPNSGYGMWGDPRTLGLEVSARY
jgi:iron complex outermembrane receptor protein